MTKRTQGRDWCHDVERHIMRPRRTFSTQRGFTYPKKKTIPCKMPDYPTIDLNMLLDNLKRDVEHIFNTWSNFGLHQKVGAAVLVIGILYALFGDSVKIGVAIGVAGAILVIVKPKEDKDDMNDPTS